MRRWLCIATFTLGMLAVPVWAQRHGSSGGGGAHFASGGGHSSGSFRSGSSGHNPSYGSSFSSGTRSSGVRSSGVHVQIGSPNYRRRFGYGPGSYYPYGPYYPYYSWYAGPLDYQSNSDYQNNNNDQTADSSADYAGPYRDDSGLQSDVQALNGKVDRLQADMEARNRPKAEMQPATALVFRDQHVEEVRNYAISGGTLWVLNEQAAKKIPLTQLDIDATVKMNDDRGVDFQVPEPAMQIMIVR
jgi:hypothetical protein